jgi:hypothetical protein
MAKTVRYENGAFDPYHKLIEYLLNHQGAEVRDIAKALRWTEEKVVEGRRVLNKHIFV